MKLTIDLELAAKRLWSVQPLTMADMRTWDELADNERLGYYMAVNNAAVSAITSLIGETFDSPGAVFPRRRGLTTSDEQ